MKKYIYVCLTSDGIELNLESDETLFIDELIELAGREDLMILEVKEIEKIEE